MRILVSVAMIIIGLMQCRNAQAEEHTLTVEQARQRVAELKQTDELDLNTISSLSPEVAKELVQHEGAILLGGLTKVSPETATWLATHKGYIRLAGLVTPSEDVMRALGKHQGILHFHLPRLVDSRFDPNGPRYCSAQGSKTVEPLAALAAMSNGTLHITGGHRVHPLGRDGGVWKALARKETGCLVFWGWPSDEGDPRPLPADLIKTASALHFPDLEKISASDAKVLTQHKGREVFLGIQTLDSPVAKALAKYPGLLELPRMTTITDLAVAQLKNCTAKIKLPNLTDATAEVREMLRENPNIEVPALR